MLVAVFKDEIQDLVGDLNNMDYTMVNTIFDEVPDRFRLRRRSVIDFKEFSIKAGEDELPCGIHEILFRRRLVRKEDVVETNIEEVWWWQRK